eukprot:939288-Prymnesium_polylepis.1
MESVITEAWYTSDANLAAKLESDGVKFDTQPNPLGKPASPVGPNWNITKWAIALNATGRPMMIEDCLDKYPDGTPLFKSTHPSLDVLHDPVHCPLNPFARMGKVPNLRRRFQSPQRRP